MEDQNVQLENNAPQQNLMVPIAIVIAGALIAAGIYFSSGGNKTIGGQNNLPTNPPIKASDLSREELLKGAMVIGDPDAPVLLVEFADFQCPFCGKFTLETRPTIIDQYVKTGKVLLAYHDFTFLGPESIDAAVAGRCANDQGKFWQFHDYVYKHLWDTYYAKGINGENVGALSKQNLKKFAAALKLDTNAFNSCLDKDTHKEEVSESTELGRSAGVTGTPGFLINGKLMVGALPYAEFKKAIDEALEKAE